jgi:hypothetical protein
LFCRKDAALLVALTLILPGCSRLAHVSGRVVEDGKPYTPTEEMVALEFARVDSSMRLSVSVQKDGSFVVFGPNNEGLPPGKYKVGYYSDVEGNKAKKRIKALPAEKSPLELDLAAGSSWSITVDLVQGTLTKQ